MKVISWPCPEDWWLSASRAAHPGLGSISPFFLCCATLLHHLGFIRIALSLGLAYLFMQKPNGSRDCPFLVARQSWQGGPVPAPCSANPVLLSGRLVIKAEQGFPGGGSWTMSKWHPEELARPPGSGGLADHRSEFSPWPSAPLRVRT